MNKQIHHTVETSFTPDPALPLALLRACPTYKVSPLVEVRLDNHCTAMFKDETKRMGLGSFKALGGPYAVARIIEERWRERTSEGLSPEDYQTSGVLKISSQMTFVCASAGNHGIGVAAGARLFGANSRIYLAETVPDSFKKRLNQIGAEVVRAGATYEESVAAAIQDSLTTGATLLADGTWPGYTVIPSYVMEGYTVIAEELREVFEENGNWPTDVYLQAGVGGFAAAIATMIRHNWSKQPRIIVVEPEAAPCVRESVQCNASIGVEGPESNMGRLDCKEPSLVAWQALARASVSFQSISDDDAIKAVGILETMGFNTTPSGGAGFAAMHKVTNTEGRNDDFRPLVIITEGQT